jgi:hypothetical protein
MAQNTDQQVKDLEARVKALETQNAKLMERLDAVTTDVESSKKAAEQAKPVVEQPSGIASTTSVGGDIRWRGEMFDNVWDFNDDDPSELDDSWEYNRIRTRVWLDAKPIENVAGYVRLTNEYKPGDVDYESFSNASSVNDTKDIAIDNAYIEVSNILDQNLRLRLGRQDIVFGEGFVFLDGTPYDGSETIAFDAIRLTYTLEDSGTSIDLVQAKTSEGVGPALADDEEVSALYITGDWIKGENFSMKFEPYVLYRNRNYVGTYRVPPDTLAVESTQPKLWTAMPGLRVSGKIYDNFTYAAELAYQFGELEDYGPGGEDVDRDAWGGYAWGMYTFAETEWEPSIKAGFTYLSGDEKTSAGVDTGDFEGWDSFYAEWPKFSELYIYSVWDPMPQAAGVDPDMGAYTNMYMPEVKVTVNPTEKLRLSLRCLYYWAVEDDLAGDGDTFKRGDGRGLNPQLMAEYQFNKFLSGYLLGDYFEPGDFYDEEDAAYFLRAEMMLKF